MLENLMNRLAAFFAIMWLSVGSVLAQGGYEFVAPPGWQQVEANGGVVLAPAPANNPAQTAIVLLPVQRLTSDMEGQFNALRTAMEQMLKLRSVQMTPPTRNSGAGVEHILIAGIYASDGGSRTVVFFARGENGVFGMGAFMTAASNTNSIQEASGFLSSLRFSADAPQIAANGVNIQGNGGGSEQPQAPQMQPRQQPQQQQQRQAPSGGGSGKSAAYNSCMQHCQTMSSMCSMGGGHYFGGNNWQSGRPCLSELTGCQVRCSVNH